jgi:hypothetical protein
MSAEHPQTDATEPPLPRAITPITDMTDPRVIQMMSTEHWSLLSARSLAYNEAFVRGGMFLTFLSMSFVALALLSSAMTFGTQFLTVAAILMAFVFVIGLTTYGRISGANVDDLRAMHGMARIRHAYTEISPMLSQYFTTPTHDDIESVVAAYGVPAFGGGLGQLLYALTTSGGMIGLIVSMVGGVLAGIIGLLMGASGDAAVWIGLIGGVIVFVLLVVATFGLVPRAQAGMDARFPAPDAEG